ncbi:Ig-like domain-containing protein, partial [Pseudomonas asplenii]|uniref:Ig-like domain-containing protein n=1 Tax=Pseudomonas asplenii TaxID=53407 RepID=UPI000288C3CD
LPITVGSALRLKEPEVLETTEPGGNQLNPIHAETAVTVRVRYDGMSNTDNIQVYWKGVAGIGSPVVPPQAGNAAQGYVDFTLSGAIAVGPNIGKTVEVSYEVTRAGATKPSPALDLTVQSLPVSALPPLQILQANADGQVDVNGTVTFRVNAWPFYRQGDRVWLALESNSPGVNRLPIWTASSISAGEFEQRYLQRVITSIPAHAEWLRALAHGSTLRVIFKVAFGGSSNEAEALVFPTKTYTVSNVVEVPTITSVKNASGTEIANGSTIVTTTVTLTGTAAIGQRVEIRDGNNVMHTATANGSGAWSTPALPVTAKGYSITARGLYGSNPVSTPARTFTVVPLLTIPNTRMYIEGRVIKVTGWTAIGTFPNSTGRRTASGGLPAYRYTSSNTAVASVAADGLVTGVSNGTATITVTDQSNQSANYPVTVSNIVRLHINEGPVNYNQAVAWMNSIGGSPLSDVDVRLMKSVYGDRLSVKHYWLCSTSGCVSGYAFWHYVNLSVQCADAHNTNITAAWCLKPI